MAVTYFISSAGSDSNNGLGPDASHATNKPYLTLGKALNTGAAVLAGDTIWIGPGIIYQAGTVCTPLTAVSSVASPLAIRGDPSNSQGFKDGSGVRLAPAPVWVTQRTSGEGPDTVMASVANLFTFGANSCKGIQFYDLCLEANQNGGILASVSLATNSDLLFQDCRLMAQSIMVPTSAVATATRNFTFRRSTMFCSQVLTATAPASAAATANADLTILAENCLVYGRLAATLGLSSTGGNLAGGIRFRGCTVMCTVTVITTTAGKVSTVQPIEVEGCSFLIGAPVNAGTSGHVISNGYNRFYNTGASTNFSLAGTDVEGPMPQLVLPDLEKWGLMQPRSDTLAWDDAAHANQKFSAWTNTTPGFWGRTARPWGAGASIGCFQNVNVAHDVSSAISTGGTDSLKLTGAGWIFLGWVPVDAVATTISITTKSTSYGGTNYPRLHALANPDIGVNADVVATASSASEQVVSLASTTPTAKGALAVFGESRSSSVTSATFFDNLASA